MNPLTYLVKNLVSTKHHRVTNISGVRDLPYGSSFNLNTSLPQSRGVTDTLRCVRHARVPNPNGTSAYGTRPLAINYHGMPAFSLRLRDFYLPVALDLYNTLDVLVRKPIEAQMNFF
ncbi:hypothetical protein EVAR_16162_1 [Eumeta japonica]|uniref:Uncharacterized protein n=1 Tax=Eumeta variegata TaxID=151549 RepID=A0A4C1WBR3_EUMVA|nr:hypothetical protein EVAR_16162_1 [Eumeta japonica]